MQRSSRQFCRAIAGEFEEERRLYIFARVETVDAAIGVAELEDIQHPVLSSRGKELPIRADLDGRDSEGHPLDFTGRVEGVFVGVVVAEDA